MLSDTIEGKIYLLLTDKLLEIAKTLGKVDEHGNVAEDLKSQILGQLSDRLSYDTLYREALSDPELHRTREELEAAMSNANEARQVVFELFQDLDGFSLDDYRPFADIDAGKRRIMAFLEASVHADGGELRPEDDGTFRFSLPEVSLRERFTLGREQTQENEALELIGLDHPILVQMLKRWKAINSENLGVSVGVDAGLPAGVLTIWIVESFGGSGDSNVNLIPMAMDLQGQRVPLLEKLYAEVFALQPRQAGLDVQDRKRLLDSCIEPALQRELLHRGLARQTGGLSAELLAWVEVV